MTWEIRAIAAGTCDLTAPLVFLDGTEDESFHLTAWAFYLHHKKENRHCLFDLGVAENWEETVPGAAWLTPVGRSTMHALRAHGIDPAVITHAFLSHAHFDHVGDPSEYPQATLVYGCGTQAAARPGYPINKDAIMTESSFPDGRVHELTDAEFVPADQAPHIQPFERAVDFFGDGSFWLVDAPGHMGGHQVGLAKTERGWVVLGGDSCHMCEHLKQVTAERAGEPVGRKMCGRMHSDEATAKKTIGKLVELREKGYRLALSHVGDYQEWQLVDVEK